MLDKLILINQLIEPLFKYCYLKLKNLKVRVRRGVTDVLIPPDYPLSPSYDVTVSLESFFNCFSNPENIANFHLKDSEEK